MSQSASSATVGTAGVQSPQRWVDRHHFLLRRLHSLTGVVPLGAFVFFHLFTNFQMLFGGFQHEVEWIHNLPALLFLEIFGIWLPLAFHGILGLVYTHTGRPNTTQYTYGDNRRYLWQRITGIIALVFIFFHIATLRWGWSFGNLIETPFVVTGPENQPLAFASTAWALQHGPLDGWLITVGYIIGVLAVVYHLANGLWTFAITWGLTLSVQAQRRWGAVCAVLGLVLAMWGMGAVYAARTHEVTEEERQAIMQVIEEARGAEAEAAGH